MNIEQNIEEIIRAQDNRITELEAQQSDLLKLHYALAASQSIWPNNWSQPVAMIAYHFHLMQAQLADAKLIADLESSCASQAISALAPYQKNAEMSLKGLRTAVIALAAASEIDKSFQSSYQAVSDCIEAIQAEGKQA